jgi:hypothetical protein
MYVYKGYFIVPVFGDVLSVLQVSNKLEVVIRESRIGENTVQDLSLC